MICPVDVQPTLLVSVSWVCSAVSSWSGCITPPLVRSANRDVPSVIPGYLSDYTGFWKGSKWRNCFTLFVCWLMFKRYTEWAGHLTESIHLSEGAIISHFYSQWGEREERNRSCEDMLGGRAHSTWSNSGPYYSLQPLITGTLENSRAEVWVLDLKCLHELVKLALTIPKEEPKPIPWLMEPVMFWNFNRTTGKVSPRRVFAGTIRCLYQGHAKR